MASLEVNLTKVPNLQNKTMTEIKKAAAASAPVVSLAKEPLSFADAIAAAINAAQSCAIPAMREKLASPLSDGDVSALKAAGWANRPIGAPSGQRGLMAPRGRGADSRPATWPDFTEVSGNVSGLRVLFAAAFCSAAVQSAEARISSGKSGGIVWIPDVARFVYSLELDFQSVEAVQRYLVSELSTKIMREQGYLIIPELPSGQFPQFLTVWDKGIAEFNHNLASGNIIEPEPEKKTDRQGDVVSTYF